MGGTQTADIFDKLHAQSQAAGSTQSPAPSRGDIFDLIHAGGGKVNPAGFRGAYQTQYRGQFGDNAVLRFLPRGNSKVIDPGTAQIFYNVYGQDPKEARRFAAWVYASTRELVIRSA
jgi:hypothetical protein